MPVATISTQTEVFTVFSGLKGYQAISDLGTRTPVFKSVEKLQDFISRESRILKTKTRL